MLINIRGTSGSGKSTLVREVMKRYDKVTPFKQEEIYHDPLPDGTSLKPRKQPLGYWCSRLDERRLVVLGHYETACGGCDSIGTYDLIFDMVRRFHGDGHDVLFEGLLISGDLKHIRLLRQHLGQDLNLLVIGLTEMSIDDCAAAVTERRATKAASKGVEARDFGPNFRTNIEGKWKTTKKCCDELEKDGVRVVRADRALALETIVKELRLNR